MDLGTLLRIKRICAQGNYIPSYPTRYILKFGTIYLPGSIKDIRLYLRSNASYNGYLRSVPRSKILIKQSYLVLMWFYYLNLSLGSSNGVHYNSPHGDAKLLTKGFLKSPSFFIYPTRVSKTTIQKAPMAHKTFSQEQFMVRFYLMSFSYTTFPQLTETIPNNSATSGVNRTVTSGINNSVYVSIFISSMAPNISTNLLFLQRYSVFFYSTDGWFFSLFRFNY